MKTRLSRLLLAVGLLAVVWPRLAHLIGGTLVAASHLTATHPRVAIVAAAGVLLLGTVPGPIDRALTRLAGK